jgi:hypothetical protein
MKIKVISDGTAEGTKVMGEDGTAIENVLAVMVKISAKKNTAEATIKIACPVVDVNADMTEVTKVEIKK